MSPSPSTDPLPSAPGTVPEQAQPSRHSAGAGLTKPTRERSCFLNSVQYWSSRRDGEMGPRAVHQAWSTASHATRASVAEAGSREPRGPRSRPRRVGVSGSGSRGRRLEQGMVGVLGPSSEGGCGPGQVSGSPSSSGAWRLRHRAWGPQGPGEPHGASRRLPACCWGARGWVQGCREPGGAQGSH